MLAEALSLICPPMISKLTEELVNRRSTKVRLAELEDAVRRMVDAQRETAMENAELRRMIMILVRMLVVANPELFWRDAEVLAVSPPQRELVPIALGQYTTTLHHAVERRRERAAPQVPAGDLDDALDEFGDDFDGALLRLRRTRGTA
ncbi:hypothetical protein [Dactylosporangium salmoneum]|uniref:Uncharacterized protein n=1 Tax=Dactylosporangium salmoneum TaxID=53361 RepID=A0ABN3HDW1_9ACTN